MSEQDAAMWALMGYGIIVSVIVTGTAAILSAWRGRSARQNGRRSTQRSR